MLNNQEAKENGRKRGGKKHSRDQMEEEAPQGFIHVRARRGQATDSHSLAERVNFFLNFDLLLVVCAAISFGCLGLIFCYLLWHFLQVRRERISERMRMLQALVPGCDKVRSLVNY